MKDEDFRVGVVEQVEELVVEIAVVDVDGDCAQLEGRKMRFEILVAVVEIEAHLRVGLQSSRRERGGEPRSAIVVHLPGASAFPRRPAPRGHRWHPRTTPRVSLDALPRNVPPFAGFEAVSGLLPARIRTRLHRAPSDRARSPRRSSASRKCMEARSCRRNAPKRPCPRSRLFRLRSPRLPSRWRVQRAR